MVLLTRALGKEKQKENNLEVGSAEIGFGRSLLHIELTDNYVRCSVYGRSRTYKFDSGHEEPTLLPYKCNARTEHEESCWSPFPPHLRLIITGY